MINDLKRLQLDDVINDRTGQILAISDPTTFCVGKGQRNYNDDVDDT